MTSLISNELLSRIEDASLNASAPPQQRWLDGWLVRYAPGKARRARCVNAVAAGRLPLAPKLAYVRELFSQAGLPLVLRITHFTQPPQLDDELAALGYPADGHTLVSVKTGLDSTCEGAYPTGHLTAHLTAHPPALPAGFECAPLDLDAFAHAVGALRGSPAAHCQSHATRLRLSPVPVQGFGIRHSASGEVVACGQVTQEAELVGLYDVVTHNAYRGRGLASVLCEHMLTVAAINGGKIAYLQVEANNLAAQRIYRRLGFVDGYNYHYRELPAGAAG
jgi:ribosomal protein S18 acetylase RimI-like enzyme